MIEFIKKRTLEEEKIKILVVRFDAIGDYVLFRNFLSNIRSQYENAQITLLGNYQWRELAEHFDSEVLDEFIWIDRNKYRFDAKYSKKFDKSLKKIKYDTLISSTYSREACVLEPLISRINAREKVGFWGDLTNITGADRIISANNYTKIISSEDKPMFEFLRNKEFFKKLFNQNIDIYKPFFVLKEDKKYDFQDSKYAIVFPGAQFKNREWNTENYTEVISYITKVLGLKVVLLGSVNDITKGQEITKIIDTGNIVNLIGKTKLYELPYIFSKAEFSVSGDTCAYHFAVAAGIQTYCISNGNTFCRFVPYPTEVFDNSYCVFPPAIENSLDDFEQITNNYIYSSQLNINSIQPEQVISLIRNNYNIKENKQEVLS